MYILGHALVVLALGVAAIVLAEQLPDSVDAVMERVVGATLVVLGMYVVVSLVRHGRDFRMKSRWMLVFGGVRRGVRWVRRRRAGDPLLVVTHEHAHDPSEPHPDVHEARVLVGGHGVPAPTPAEHRHGHRHIGSLPDDPFDQYGKPTAFGVGMIHGIGAETPTQVLLFLAAAGAGGEAQGLLLLACFIVGLVSSNSLIAGASTFGFLNASRNWHVYVTVSVITAAFSLVIGMLFLTGGGSVLPAFFAG
jgi:high-affinity nickel-transport protein